MAKNYRQKGDVLSFTAGAALASGQGLILHDQFGVVAGAAAIGADAELFVEGVFELDCLGTDTISTGMDLYWDNGNSRLTLASAGNRFAGKAANESPNGSPTVWVKLVPSAAP